MEEIKDNWIFDGNNFWPDPVLHGLKERHIPDSLYDSLYKAQMQWPDKWCLVDDNGTACTYRQLWHKVNDFAELLFHVYHVRQGMHVGILLYNSLEFCVSIYALNKLGAAAVPLPTKYRRPEIWSLIEKADLKGVIFHKDFEEWFPDEDKEMFHICLDVNALSALQHIHEPEMKMFRTEDRTEDTAILMFTSGTTSHSKGVLLTNSNIMHAVIIYQKIFHISEKDKTVIPVPAYHVTGLVALIALFLHAGGCIWLHKYFDADRVLKEITDQHMTFLHASPTVFSFLLEKRKDYPELPYVKAIACGSSNMPKNKIMEMKKWMPQAEFHTVYGLTETSSPAAVFPGDAAGSEYIGSSGFAVPGLQFKICDEQGNSLPPLKTGSVVLRGTTVTPGYYRQSRDVLSDGWLDTGDMGYFNQEGYLYIVDRKKDMINRGGEKVCGFDVENVLYGIPGIREAAVVGIEDERYGEVPAAMVAADPEAMLTEETIRGILKTQLAKFQIPAKIMFCKRLPLTANMKIDKKEIRRQLSNKTEEEK
ncbi:MAG: class I adenylate-forming enzyme family protein [Lachnospiraceae bacterium]